MHPRTPPDNSAPRDPEEVRAAISILAAANPGAVELDHPLAGLTTFRIGGPALGLVRVANPAEAARFLTAAREASIPVVCIGGGSNLLIDDRGFCGLALKMEITDVGFDGDRVTAGAGLPFDELIARCLDRGLTGLEFASGIPGSVGGAVAGNAGCYGHEIGEFLVSAEVLRPEGKIMTLAPEDLEFSYRHSALKENDNLLLRVELQLERGDLEAALAVRMDHMAQRRVKHPVSEPCAGSYFKNLEPAVPGGRRRAAGELLDRAGVHGMRVGGAAVFPGHANIIINTGGATCSDVLELAERMRRAVSDSFGVELVPEVRYLPWNSGDSSICG